MPSLVERWNRKLHYYSGLFLLLFLWLFSFSGLMLNHPEWGVSNFYPKRIQTNATYPIDPPPAGADLSQAQDLMRQLKIVGEVEWTTTRPRPQSFDFRVSRPGFVIEIHSDLSTRQATVHSLRYNTSGLMHVLHTFTGVRKIDPNNERDWLLTKIWSFCMDAVAAGLILMVLSSVYMWYGLKRKRVLGWLALSAGAVGCGFFLVGLAWLYPMR